jgi:hypothetical protein
MKRPFLIAAACVAILLFASPGHADFVCRLNKLDGDFLSVRVGADPGSIELARLDPGVIVQVVEISPDGVWKKITSPGHPSGWVLANNICPGMPE